MAPVAWLLDGQLENSGASQLVEDLCTSHSRQTWFEIVKEIVNYAVGYPANPFSAGHELDE